MPTDYDSSLLRSLLSEQLDMAAGLGALREAQRQTEMHLDRLDYRCTSLETTISRMRPVQLPPRPEPPSPSRTDTSMDTWMKRASYLGPALRALMYVLPRALIALGIAQGWLLAVWRWFWALAQSLPIF